MKYMHSGNILHRDLVNNFLLIIFNFLRNQQIYYLIREIVCLKFVILDYQERYCKQIRINKIQM